MTKSSNREVYKWRITDSIELISNKPHTQKNREGEMPKLLLAKKRPLVVLSTWVQAKQAHIDKYVQLYLGKGFDILTVQTSYRQILFPKSGYIANSSDLVNFLKENPSFEPIVTHSLSVGSAVWVEAEKRLVDDERTCKNIIDSVKGRIWDSSPAGPLAGPLSYLIIPKDGLVRRAMEIIIRAALFLTHFFLNRYLMNTEALFFDPPLKSPNLMLISKDDMIGRYDYNMKALEKWNSMGIKFQVKCWEKSVHVSHFFLHRDEYENEIDAFLKTIGIDNLMDKGS